MVSDGKTQREIATYYSLKDKLVIKQLLIRERRKENHIALGIVPIAKDRPRKSDIISEQDKYNEIKSLKMEI